MEFNIQIYVPIIVAIITAGVTLWINSLFKKDKKIAYEIERMNVVLKGQSAEFDRIRGANAELRKENKKLQGTIQSLYIKINDMTREIAELKQKASMECRKLSCMNREPAFLKNGRTD